MKTRSFPENNYKAFYFNDKTVRIALDPSKPITELKHPEFYDVKLTDNCRGGCPECYMDSVADAEPYKDVLDKIQQFFGSMTENEKPFQVAIGGGEPTESPEFLETLVLFTELGITPNYTTNGMFLDRESGYIDDVIDYTKRYCGGVAVSCHPHLYYHWTRAASMLHRNKIKLSLHLIISDKTSVDRFRGIYKEWESRVDYFVLLPYAAQGRATPKEVNWDYLVEHMPKDTTKIAFGANFYPQLCQDPTAFKVSLYEPESMSRFLDLKDMRVYPSSFHMS